MCLLVVCALSRIVRPSTAAIGSRRWAGVPGTETGLPARSCWTNIPSRQEEFELVEFYPGKRNVAVDMDDDGRWERVYIPVFEKPLKDIRQNYRAIVICYAGVGDEVELRKQLQARALPAQYWPYSQKFDKNTYNALAERYSSLDFNRSMIVHCGFPRADGIARYLYWGGAIGALFAMLSMGWQSLGLVLIAIRKSAAVEQAMDDEEELEDDILEQRNHIGLPTMKRE